MVDVTGVFSLRFSCCSDVTNGAPDRTNIPRASNAQLEPGQLKSSMASIVAAVATDMIEVSTQGGQLLESETAVSILQAGGGRGDLMMMHFRECCGLPSKGNIHEKKKGALNKILQPGFLPAFHPCHPIPLPVTSIQTAGILVDVSEPTATGDVQLGGTNESLNLLENLGKAIAEGAEADEYLDEISAGSIDLKVTVSF